MPLRDLDSEIENIEKFFLLGLSQPAQERDGLKELEANFKKSAKTGDLQALQTLTNPHLQTPDINILHSIDFIQNELSLASKEINDYYHLIHQAPGQVKELEQKFNEDLGRWKTLSAQNQPDPFGLFEEVDGAAFALKTFPRAAPFEDHQAPDQHDSGISMGTSVEDSMYYQMPDEGADDPWAPFMQ
ncbi:hypothetical protein Forpi1262_v005122 [Fusarium oxysporum f. sp. raphani]|uniref:Uncharacterized protein n=1 Tax=Fusarium oxysporum f. sp. raphani TaxID=96318 RepID=A0A8J5UB04_FUSOX|nr:hypothetical protein Forpi1262_v005122 [Fusarium oxysporum f. sp. raphani]